MEAYLIEISENILKSFRETYNIFMYQVLPENNEI